MTQTNQRKLAAIMFTDMVGYSAITQKNENLALQLLEEHREIVRRILPKYNGKEIETPGDAFFVKFSSALQAVHCAIEVQKTFYERNISAESEEKIILRAGVHLGDVVEKGKSVLGDCVNIAARIEPLARPGCVCVSQDVARQIQNKIDYPLRKIEKQKLKNIKIPVDIFAIDLPWVPDDHPARLRIAPRIKFDIKKWRPFFIGGIALIVIILAVVIRFSYQNLPLEKKAIAVLPFKNIGGDREDEYFSDGMTEDVIAHLAKISGLKVISRTSVMQYKGQERNLKEIGDELDVGIILEGSVRREGNKIRIVAQLLDANKDDHLWVETYNEELTQIFAIQSAVAEKIAASLKTRITSAEKSRMVKEATNDMAAYDLYLRGRYHWNKRLPEDLNKGIEYFKQALKLDTNYALAYTGLADSYLILGNYALLPPAESFTRAKQAAEIALELNDQLAEAHTSLAYTLCFSDWNWFRAEEEFKHALRLNQNLVQTYSWYSLYLTFTGRFAEAEKMRERALQLDPFSVVLNADIGLALYLERKYDRAIEQNLKTLQMDPGLGALAHFPLGAAYLKKSRYSEAIESFSQMSRKLTGIIPTGHQIPIATLGYGYAYFGKEDRAEDMLELLMDKAKEEYVSPFWLAVLHTSLGQHDQALDWLEKAVDERDGFLVYLKVIPVFDPLRSQNRFISILQKIGLSGPEL